MKDDTEPVTPQTPERKLAPAQPTPKSSRVTINVRTPSRHLETIPSSPPVSEKELEQGSSVDMMLDEDVKTSVEEAEVQMATGVTPDPNLASSSSETSSPPVEVITIDDDDGPEYESAQPQVTLLQAARDPTADFPFHDAAESLADTVSRLTNFITSRMFPPQATGRGPPLTRSVLHPDDTVAKSVSDWIQIYIAFAKVSDHYTVWDSYRQNREFWHTVPELVNCIITRRYETRSVSYLIEHTDLAV